MIYPTAADAQQYPPPPGSQQYLPPPYSQPPPPQPAAYNSQPYVTTQPQTIIITAPAPIARSSLGKMPCQVTWF